MNLVALVVSRVGIRVSSSEPTENNKRYAMGRDYKICSEHNEMTAYLLKH